MSIDRAHGRAERLRRAVHPTVELGHALPPWLARADRDDGLGAGDVGPRVAVECRIADVDADDVESSDDRTHRQADQRVRGRPARSAAHRVWYAASSGCPDQPGRSRSRRRDRPRRPGAGRPSPGRPGAGRRRARRRTARPRGEVRPPDPAPGRRRAGARGTTSTSATVDRAGPTTTRRPASGAAASTRSSSRAPATTTSALSAPPSRAPDPPASTIRSCGGSVTSRGRAGSPAGRGPTARRPATPTGRRRRRPSPPPPSAWSHRPRPRRGPARAARPGAPGTRSRPRRDRPRPVRAPAATGAARARRSARRAGRATRGSRARPAVGVRDHRRAAPEDGVAGQERAVVEQHEADRVGRVARRRHDRQAQPGDLELAGDERLGAAAQGRVGGPDRCGDPVAQRVRATRCGRGGGA